MLPSETAATPITGCFDADCKCGRKISWAGDLRDRPPCPGCGYTVPPEEVERDLHTLKRIFFDPSAEFDGLSDGQLRAISSGKMQLPEGCFARDFPVRCRTELLRREACRG